MQCRSDRPNNVARLPTPEWPWVGRRWPAAAALYSCRSATKKARRRLCALLVSATREDGGSKTPERENELLLRLAPRVDTGVHSDLFSKGTKRTQTHLVRFVVRQLCHSVFSKHCKMDNRMDNFLLYMTAWNSFSLKLPTCRQKRKSFRFYSAVNVSKITFKRHAQVKKVERSYRRRPPNMWEQVKMWYATKRLLKLSCTCLGKK